MKKIITSLLLVVGLSAFAQSVASTNLVTSGVGGNSFLLLNTRASVYQIQASGTAETAATLRFYDQSTLAAPYYGTNYVTAANVGRASYTTNTAYSYVGVNGLTNWYTNSYLWTYYITNAAATNQLTPSHVMVVPAGQIITMDTSMLNTRGVCVHATTNSIVTLYYNSGQ